MKAGSHFARRARFRRGGIGWLATAPVVVFLLVSAASVGLWWVAYMEDTRQLETRLQVTTQQVAYRIQTWFDSRMATASYLQQSWPEKYSGHAEAYTSDARILIRMFPGIQAVNWVDPKGTIRIVVPSAGNEAALNKNLFENPLQDVRNALRKAAFTGVSSRTPGAVKLLQGGLGFTVYLPVSTPEGEQEGFLNVVFKVDAIVDAITVDRELTGTFRIALVENSGAPIFASHRDTTPDHWAMAAQYPIRFVDQPVMLVLAPVPAAVPMPLSGWRILILLFGFGSAAALSWLTANAMRRTQALRDSEERYRAVAEDSPVLIYRFQNNGQMEYMNETALKYFKAEESELDQILLFDLVAPDDRAHVRAAVASLTAQHPTTTVEHRTADDAGAIRWLRTAIHALADAHGQIVAYQAVSEDITERIHAEERRLMMEIQMQHAQKLESLGIMAGGIAHDFNNILTGILGHASLARAESTDPVVNESIDEIERGAKRAADLCGQLLAYSGKGRFESKRIDLAELVREMGNMLQVSISKKASIRYELASALPPIEGDPTQIRQVVMNLIINASEALEDGDGEILVSTEFKSAHAERFRDAGWTSGAMDGPCVVLTVSDTGCGIEPEIIERIFDPFFTTKFTGRGLGMAAVLGIIHSHHGVITIDSVPGGGSTFRVWWPAAIATEAASALLPPSVDDWRGEGTILLVDDEEAVMRVCGRMLQHIGFDVLTARDGVEALAVFASNQDVIVCVILDLTMPRMDGAECFKALQRIQPGLPVVLCSGYDEQEVAQRLIGEGLAAFIQKPYELKRLRATLYTVLCAGTSAFHSGESAH